MDLRLLGYFVATVDHGSATSAAVALHVTQPVLSRQLRQLESRLGVQLFERRKGRLLLTRAGEQLAELARDLLARADLVERAAEELASGRIDTLHLAVPTTTLTDVVAPFIASLGEGDPVPLVRELDPRGASAALRAGADLAIVTRPPARSLASAPLAELPVWAYVRPEDRPDSDAITLRDLVQHPVIAMAPDFRPRALLDAALEAASLSYGELVECSNAQVAQALAAAGRGIAVVSDDPRFGLVPLTIKGKHGPLTIRLYAAWDPRHHAAGVLAGFAERIAEFCATRYPAT